MLHERLILENGKQSMSSQWQDFQATFEAVGANPMDGLIRARDRAVVCDLAHNALIAFEGPDAEGFLHSQLSSDVESLSMDRCQLSTYNSPKGRVLATLLLWRCDDGIVLQLPAAIAESTRRRLSMFILRAKVRASLADERFVRIGVGGPNARTVLTAAGLQPPDADFALVRRKQVRHGENLVDIELAMRLPGGRYELLVTNADAAISTWHSLVAHGATPAAPATWRWLTLSSGVADVVAETQDQFVAQMLNYELIGGVSFTKGCYPGQEIVARTQYRGEIRRRTLLAHAADGNEPAPAQAIFNAVTPDQAVGAVVNAAPSPKGGFDLLACLHTELAAAANLHLGKVGGPRLELLTLPYSLPSPG
jgi:hypothetical protein